MDPNNNQQINQQVPVSAPQAAPSPVVQGPEKSESSNKNLILLLVIGLAILVVLGGALFFYMFSGRSNSSQTASTDIITSSPGSEAAITESPSSVVEVQGASDLDQLLIEVAQADNSLEKELTNLEKDSSF